MLLGVLCTGDHGGLAAASKCRARALWCAVVGARGVGMRVSGRSECRWDWSWCRASGGAGAEVLGCSKLGMHGSVLLCNRRSGAFARNLSRLSAAHCLACHNDGAAFEASTGAVVELRGCRVACCRGGEAAYQRGTIRAVGCWAEAEGWGGDGGEVNGR